MSLIPGIIVIAQDRIYGWINRAIYTSNQQRQKSRLLWIYPYQVLLNSNAYRIPIVGLHFIPGPRA
ncbi:hypothetical protein IXB50_08160 [Leptothoe spongobia TAU-MAC 1115]|uniref:Uncharacterized protein n=1 Tax=Leptothoe spongobia TAU-MAC 1115 TaxID=1967444 RepID=A0A947DE18_9CYAN|nr:hypothetical protein [Leptothoe spongobia TAU-MAC 1115]